MLRAADVAGGSVSGLSILESVEAVGTTATLTPRAPRYALQSAAAGELVWCRAACRSAQKRRRDIVQLARGSHALPAKSPPARRATSDFHLIVTNGNSCRDN